MRYGLTIVSLGKWPFIEISSDEFRQIRAAKTKLTIALEIEDKFELLVENYAEHERTLLDLTLTKMIRQDYVWGSFMDHKQLINRRIANFLMAAQLYIDQAKHDMVTMFGRKSAAADDLSKAFDRESDQSLGYRVMKEVRDYVQHRALPVGPLIYPAKRQQDGKSGLRFGIQPHLNVDELRNDPGFKRSLLAEIEKEPAAQDLTYMIRQFIESLSRVHEAVRALTESEVAVCTVKLDNVVERAHTEIRHTVGLAAVEQDDEGSYREKVYVFADLTKRVHDMRSRYKNLKFSSGWYVSSGVAL